MPLPPKLMVATVVLRHQMSNTHSFLTLYIKTVHKLFIYHYYIVIIIVYSDVRRELRKH